MLLQCGGETEQVGAAARTCGVTSNPFPSFGSRSGQPGKADKWNSLSFSDGAAARIAGGRF